MTGLIVFFSIILLIFFLLLLPVTIKIEYVESLRISIKYLFIKKTIAKPKKKSTKKKKKTTTTTKKKKPKKTKKKNDTQNSIKTIKDAIKKSGLDGFLELLSLITSKILNSLSGLLHHTVFEEFKINIDVTGEDASVCAINYGKISSAVFPISSFFISNCKDYKTLNVLITPCFEKKKSLVNANIIAYIPVIWVLINVLKFLFPIVKKLLKNAITTKINEKN